MAPLSPERTDPATEPARPPTPGPATAPAAPGWPAGLRPIGFGGDYNPEQWPLAVQLEDLELMQQAGVTAVTVGVFNWALIEPAEGRYEFDLLDDVLDRLLGAGIAAVLATPTAAPPAWFSTAHPDTLPVTRDGVRLGLGAREAFCPSSPRYRAAATAIARQLAERYRAHPAVTMWHVGNEYGAHVDGCYCPVSEQAFRTWLRERYGTLDALNQAWGTTFWSQHYTAWDQLTVPRQAPLPVNPAQQLDFRRFTDAEFRACYLAEAQVLREVTPHLPVTTNFMSSSCPNVDYWAWTGDVDVVANNHYLAAEDPHNHVDLALSADLTRALAGGRPWILMEHSTSAVNWQPRNVAKRPGEMLRNSLVHVARGADAVLFFQWRASRVGAEKFHSAMLPQGGTGTGVWREVGELGRRLAALREVAGSRVVADVGVVWDWNSWWALELEYRPSVDVTYRDAVDATYRALWRRNLTVEFVRPGDVPTHLPVLVVPSLYLCSAATGAALRRYVEGGGRLLVRHFSGIVDETDTVHPGPYPGALRDVLGLWTEEFHPLAAGQSVELDAGPPEPPEPPEPPGPLEPPGSLGSLGPFKGTVWSEAVVPTTAATVWRFASGPDAGQPALTRNALGRGAAWYLATRPGDDGLGAVLDLVLADAGLAGRERWPGVEAVRRVGPQSSYLFLVNHGTSAATVPGRGVDLFTATRHDGDVAVPAGAVVVLREDHPATIKEDR